MLSRIITIIAVSGILSMTLGCMASEDMAASGFTECPGSCPYGYSEVERCPLYTTCQEVPDCGDRLLCAPDDDHDAGNQSPGEPDCDDPVTCPEGTFEVPSCPEGELCTQITLCDSHLICREAPEWCQDQPLCSDDDRPIEDCEGIDEDYCYRNQHCSGPVDCLECHEDLADECPEDTEPVARTECEFDDIECQRVETCDETLYCGSSTSCTSYPFCPGDSEQISDCAEDDHQCFVVDGCEGEMYCGIDSNGYCNGEPVCDFDYYEVPIDECLDDLSACDIQAECGFFVACLPVE